MIDLDKWQEIAATLGQNKLRTALTALGVFWGLFMLIWLLAIGDSLRRGVQQDMVGFAPNAIWAGGRRTSMPHAGLKPGRWVQFETADIAHVAALPGVAEVAPRIHLGGWRGGNNISRGAKTGNYNVAGDYPAVRHVLRFTVTEGRFLNPLDLAERRKVAVIGQTIYQQLFPPGMSPIGEHLSVRGVDFEVIGVLKAAGPAHEVDRHEQTVFVPFTTFQQAFNGRDKVNIFGLLTAPGADADQVEQRLRALLAERHRFHPEDKEAIWAFNSAKEARKITLLFLAIKLLMWFVGGMTLMAGVLGVSNIMLIAVKERTKELGVRKALGATPGQIIRMVLAEAVALTLLAGYLGLLAAVATIELVGPLLDGVGPLVAPMVDFEAALLATLILVAGGTLAGVIPARHAASIKPVEALRAE
jgi:putative ABC transport system permease protein